MRALLSKVMTGSMIAGAALLVSACGDTGGYTAANNTMANGLESDPALDAGLGNTGDMMGNTGDMMGNTGGDMMNSTGNMTGGDMMGNTGGGNTTGGDTTGGNTTGGNAQ